MRKNKRGWALLELPKTQVDKNMPFAFNLYRFKFDGLIFLLTALVIPFICLIIFRFVGKMGTNQASNWWQLGYLLIEIICLIVAIIYYFQKDPRLFIKSGLFIFYAFQILPILISLIFSPFINNHSEVSTLVSLWLQVLVEVVIIAFAMWWVTDLKDRIVFTFKHTWKLLLIVFVVGTIVMVAISIVYGLIVKNTSLGGDSNNQNSLTSILTSSNVAVKILGVISLFVFTVLVAPLVEELATRQAWFVGVGNRTLAWITSAIFFGMMHVTSGDIEHILSYFLAGLVLSTIFSISRGNVSYDWIVHAGSNLIVLILTLIQNL